MTSPVSSRAQADLALAVYLEPLADGRRVLLLGEAQGDLADRFDRVASHLEIIDPGAREPSRGEVPELPFDDRAFDLIVVCDVSALPQPTAGAVRELHRVLSRSGVLALSELHPGAGPRRRRGGGAPQSTLARLLSNEFRHVRLFSQSPIAGFALTEQERDASNDFSIDSSLLGGKRREVERLLGLASDTGELPIEPNLWVEVPWSPPAAAPVADPRLVEELRRAEDEAREALHRESDLLRKLESERNARLDAEHLLERAESFERKLLAAEADYDDAVARVRYFESAIAEHEAAVGHERQRREASERELGHLKSELNAASERVKRAEHERDAARAELEAASAEHEQLEGRLTELGKLVIVLGQDKKDHEETARDLLEELRRLELDRTAVVEHDARVAELEAERDRALQRALESEVAREAAQMRADELRAELEDEPSTSSLGEISGPALAELRESAAAHEMQLTRANHDLARLRGECHGLRLRLSEAELALGAASSPGEQLMRTKKELSELRFRLSHTEAVLHAIRESPQGEAGQGTPSSRESELERELASAQRRVGELNRELEEADRFAELHAEDAERFAATESELEGARRRLEELDEEVRVLDSELRNVRDDLRTAREQHARARAEVDAIAAEGRAQQAQIQQLERDQEARVRAEVDASKADIRAREAQLDRERDEARAARTELETIRGRIRIREERIARLERERDDVRAELEVLRAENRARDEQVVRLERERDDARAALADARATLSQLAGRVGGDENDPTSIVQAVMAHGDARVSERQLDDARAELAERDARIAQLERRLAEARRDDANQQPNDA